MGSETRFFRSDTEIVDAVTYRKLLTSQTGVQGSVLSRLYVKFMIYKYASGGSKTLLGTTGVIDTDGIDGMYSVDWSCPETVLVTTDRIMVEVYHAASAGGAYTLSASFITEQIGATLLNAAVWTVYYYSHYWETIKVIHLKDCEYSEVVTPHWEFEFDTETYNSRITNFTWSSEAPPAAPGILIQVM